MWICEEWNQPFRPSIPAAEREAALRSIRQFNLVGFRRFEPPPELQRVAPSFSTTLWSLPTPSLILAMDVA